MADPRRGQETNITTTASNGESANTLPAEPISRASSLIEKARLHVSLLPSLLLVLALVPIILMASHIAHSTKLNYQDYWSAMLRITHPDGSLRLRGIFTYQNEHPFAIPQIVYYLDARFLGGSNQHLGYFSLLVSIGILAMLWGLAPRSWSLPMRCLFVFLCSTIIFCPSGAWNYVRGMSGVAWLTANLLSVAAIWLAFRGRTLAALALAAVAMATYGTGFGAPVALIAVALLTRGKPWRWVAPLVMLILGAAVYLATAPAGTSGYANHDPGLLAQTFLTNLATLWDSNGGTLAMLIGLAGLLLVVAGSVRYLRSPEVYQDLIPWLAIIVYTLVAAALISVGRGEAFAGNGAQGRYASLCALFWISIAVLSLRTIRTSRENATRWTLFGALAVAFWAASPPLYAAATAQNGLQNELAAALHFDATSPFTQIMNQPQSQVSRLRGLGDYPFNKGYTFGCGLKPGDSIDPAVVKVLPSSMFPTLGSLDHDSVKGDTRQASGWVFRRNNPARCVVFIDNTGKIVGAGSAAIPRSDVTASNTGINQPNCGFEAVTPASQSHATLILGFRDGFFSLPPSAAPKQATGK